MKTYKGIKLTVQVKKYTNPENSNIVMVVHKSLLTLEWKLKDKSIKYNHSYNNLSMDTWSYKKYKLWHQ